LKALVIPPLLPVRPFRATRINAPAVPAAVLQTKPESRSGLSLAHSDCPSPNSLNGVNVPWPTPSIRSELLASDPFDFEFRSSHLRGEDQHSKSVARRPKSRVSIFTALVLPFRTLRPSRSTRKCRSTREAYPCTVRPISVRSPVFVYGTVTRCGAPSHALRLTPYFVTPRPLGRKV
jgi:hypothetical protein